MWSRCRLPTLQSLFRRQWIVSLRNARTKGGRYWQYYKPFFLCLRVCFCVGLDYTMLKGGTSTSSKTMTDGPNKKHMFFGKIDIPRVLSFTEASSFNSQLAPSIQEAHARWLLVVGREKGKATSTRRGRASNHEHCMIGWDWNLSRCASIMRIFSALHRWSS